MVGGGREFRYREIARLGAGGATIVILAEDTVLGRPVALKRVYSTGDPQAMLRLKREALVGASLNHPNLVSVYDVQVQPDGGLQIVMEYVPGMTLAELVQAHGRLRPGDAVRILSALAAALDVIHARGIVHRDVKPANVLVDDEGAVKLADLGIADVADRTRVTSAGAVVGSFSYMAPEQLEGAKPSAAMDIYALAAVAYEVLSGRRARSESNPIALAYAISTQPPPDLRDAWPQAPRAAAKVLQLGMAHGPTRRPRSAGELVRRLAAALEPSRATEPLAPPKPLTPHVSARNRAALTPAPVLADAAGADGKDAAVRPFRAPRRKRGLLAGAVLALAAAAAVIVVPGATSSNQAGTRSGSPARREGPTAASHASRSRAHRAVRLASRGSTSSNRAAANRSNGHSSASPSSSPSGSANQTIAAGEPLASTPTAAVRGFYEAAAHHDYGAAWALADANMRAEVGGYAAFANQMSTVRSITFDRAQTTAAAGPNLATVVLRTTSVQVDRTQHCWGTARTIRTPNRWLLDGISIGCA